MNVMKKKLGKNSGFTLVEMLIVVAIIAILIAVSIPLISSSLEKARHAVDDANRRDAIALATVAYLTDYSKISFDDSKKTPYATFKYKVNGNSQGELDESGLTATNGGTAVTAQCTYMDSCHPSTDTKTRAYAADSTNARYTLTVYLGKDGKVVTNWDADFDLATAFPDE